MTLSLREFHPRRVEVRAARVIISRTARYHNSQFSIIHSRQAETHSKLFCIDRLIPFGFI